MLKVVLVVYAVIALVYGIGFLFVPGLWVSMSGSGPIDAGWLRWPGGVIIGFGIGAIMVSRKPEKQGIFVLSVALATLLSGLAMLFSAILQEHSGTTMFIAVPTALMFLVSGFMWWARQRAKAIL
jgi:hypothetical protein